MAMAIAPITSVLVITPSNLLQAAWGALIAAQQGLLALGAAAEPVLYSTPNPAAHPQVVLFDVPAPLEQVAQCRSVWPAANVLALVDSYELSYTVALLQAGAVGVLGHNEPVAALVRALIAAGRGELVLPAAVAVATLAALTQGQSAGAPPQATLTAREQEVLRLLAQGTTNKDIAQALFVSVRTVEAHMRSIFGKLGVRSRTEAALWAARHRYSLAE